MKSRERFEHAVNHRQPDRPPIFATFTPQVAKTMSDHLGLPYEAPLDSLLSSRISHMNLLTHLGNDAVAVAAGAPSDRQAHTDENGITTNEWGMVFKAFGIYNEFYKYPLAHARTVQDILDYPFPDPNAHGRFDMVEDMIKKYKDSFTVLGDLETVIFETSWYLVGLEKFLVDMIAGEAYVNVLLDKVMEINLETGKKLIQLGVDVLWTGDDFGTQHGMLIHPDLWRRIFKPRIKELFESFRKVNPEIKIAWHSCGSITEIIPDFIEIGLDILNPIQPKARGMEPEYLKKTFGKELVFFGGIDIQNLLAKSTPELIREEVRRISEILGEDGGFIIAPAHNVQVDTPVENIVAFFEAAKENRW